MCSRNPFVSAVTDAVRYIATKTGLEMSTVAIVLIVVIPTLLIASSALVTALICCKRKGVCCWKAKP